MKQLRLQKMQKMPLDLVKLLAKLGVLPAAPANSNRNILKSIANDKTKKPIKIMGFLISILN
ncbi:hypothetical protein AAX09_10475 (plasmid) [Moraxella bovoculi]|nr:hypothetical protein AAX09_10475 [Moraxella bovoculi]